MNDPSMLSSKIEQAIKADIISGKLEAGRKISINELRQEWGCSSTPIRDAIKSLDSKGFLIVSPRESIVVATMDREMFKEVFDLRIALECLAIELATQLIPIEKLDDVISRYQTAAKSFAETQDINCLNEVDFLLHDLVTENCGNKILKRLIHDVSDQIEWARRIIVSQPHAMEFALTEHLNVLNALRRRSIIDAQDAMRIHLKNTFRRAVETL